MNTQLLLALGALSLLLYLALSLVRWFRSPLRSVPGPAFAHLSDAWYFWTLKKGRFEEVNKSLHDKYGRSTL